MNSEYREYERRVEIASPLADEIEKLLKLLHIQSLNEHEEAKLNRILAQLYQIDERIRGDETLLGEGRESRQFLPFVIGVDRFRSWFQKFDHGLSHWGVSNWKHNNKYISKFQSAAVELRSFIILADAVSQSHGEVTKAAYEASRRRIAMERVRQQVDDYQKDDVGDDEDDAEIKKRRALMKLQKLAFDLKGKEENRPAIRKILRNQHKELLNTASSEKASDPSYPADATISNWINEEAKRRPSADPST